MKKKLSEEGLTLLGADKTVYPKHPDEARLEVIENRFGKRRYNVLLDCPEFTCVCPMTGQPDFAHILIEYCPDEKLVESKALKLYLFSFRNVGVFHEFVVNKIAEDLFKVMKPHWIEVAGDFLPRGGISIKPRVRLVKGKNGEAVGEDLPSTIQDL